MTVLIIAVAVSWVVFSGFLVTLVCMNSSRLSRIDEPFKSPAKIALERRRRMASEGHPAAIYIKAEV
jgi:hypothetical protein